MIKTVPEYLYGIDISSWNRVTDLDKVAANVDFCYIKATEGKTNESRTFQERREGLTERGVPVGAYHYAWLKKWGINEPVKQAKFFCKVVRSLGPEDLIPVLDVESGWYIPRKKIIAWINAWIEVVEEELGCMVGFYTFYNYWRYKLKKEGVWDRPLWLASTTKITKDNKIKKEKPFKEIPGWDTLLRQFSHRGRIPGIKGNVDLNRMAVEDLNTWQVEMPWSGE